MPTTTLRERVVDAPASAGGPSLAPGLALWTGLVAVAVVWGRTALDHDDGLRAAPLVGRWDLRLPPGLALAVGVGGTVVALGPRLADRLAWRRLNLVAGAATVAWAVALAAADGWDQLTAPLTTRFEYEPFAATVDSAPTFVRQFVGRVPDLPIHVKGHPPGATLMPWVLDRLGLGGAGWFAALAVAAWGGAVVAVLHAARSLAGEDAARRAAPVLVLLPAVVWAATSADALFAGVLCAGVALAVAGGIRAAVGGGVVLGAGLLLTYGGAVALAIPAAVAWRRRDVRPLLATVAGVVLVLLVAAAAGFWWPDGLVATRDEYWDGVAARRPGAYLTIVGNPAALALAVGPAVVAGIVRRRLDVLTVGALVAVLLADLSQLSRGEVERIWLPFVPWLALAAPTGRRWLAAQAASALLLQATLRSTW